MVLDILGQNNITWSAQLSDLSDVPAPTLSDTILTWDGSGYTWSK